MQWFIYESFILFPLRFACFWQCFAGAGFYKCVILGNLGAIIDYIKAQGVQSYEVDIDWGREDQLCRPNAVFTIQFHQKQTHTRVLAGMSAVEGVVPVEEL